MPSEQVQRRMLRRATLQGARPDSCRYTPSLGAAGRPELITRTSPCLPIRSARVFACSFSFSFAFRFAALDVPAGTLAFAAVLAKHMHSFLRRQGVGTAYLGALESPLASVHPDQQRLLQRVQGHRGPPRGRPCWGSLHRPAPSCRWHCFQPAMQCLHQHKGNTQQCSWRSTLPNPL